MTLIDGSTNQPIATIQVGKRPRGIAASRDGQRLYVALSGTPIKGPPGSAEAAERANLPVDHKADGIGVADLEQRKFLRLMPCGPNPECNETKMYIAT